MLTETIKKALQLEFLSIDEGLQLYENLSLAELSFIANTIRNKIHNNNIVTYIIDRNINLTNVCVSSCLFCNFCRSKNSKDAYLLDINDYVTKIEELYQYGGRQILLQGGMNPDLKLDFYINLFQELKNRFPDLKIHALGPPEIVFLSKKNNIGIKEVLQKLKIAGLDSLPGAGAEILSDRVRKIISPIKSSTNEWLEVMKIAHKIGLTTSATMMFGHLETIQERFEHIIKIRNVQMQKPANSKGFISFTIWPFASKDTRLIRKYPEIKSVSNTEYIKMTAISRIMLPNVLNIQTSWLTMGTDIAQICLNSGANDMSSIMIEENVVSQAGKQYKINLNKMKKVIQNAGFIPKERDQEYRLKSAKGRT